MAPRLRLAGAIAAGPALAMAITIAAVRTPGYSNWRDTVSRLGSPGQPWARLVQLAFVGYGLSVIAGSGAITHVRHSSRMFLASIRVYGAGAVIAGLAPKSLPGASPTTASQVHVYATVVGGIAIVTAMAMVSVTDPSPTVRATSAAAAVVVLTASAAFRFTWGASYYGAIERLVLLPALAWVTVIAMLARHQADM